MIINMVKSVRLHQLSLAHYSNQLKVDNKLKMNFKQSSSSNKILGSNLKERIRIKQNRIFELFEN